MGHIRHKGLTQPPPNPVNAPPLPLKPSSSGTLEDTPLESRGHASRSLCVSWSPFLIDPLQAIVNVYIAVWLFCPW